MNTRALLFTLLIAGSAVLGLYFCSRTRAMPSIRAANPVKEVKEVKKADIKYYTTNKAGGVLQHTTGI